MLLKQLVKQFATMFPSHYAASWDNTGLLTGDPSKIIRQVLLTIDLTSDVVQEASQRHIDLVLTYHPPLLQPIKQLPAHQPLVQACATDLAVFSPHTIWDALPGGGNDVLAKLAGLEQTRCIEPIAPCLPNEPQSYKLVVFVPQEHLEPLLQALFAAGAGTIGNYNHCSFRSRGIGSFRGTMASKPTIGLVEQNCQVEESRLEVIAPAQKLQAILQALLANHPYETPAFDIYPLHNEPVRLEQQQPGYGRIGQLATSMRCEAWLQQLQLSLGMEPLLICCLMDSILSNIAICIGSGNGIWQAAHRQGAQLLLTGEMSHHHVLAAKQAGLQVCLLRHGWSEGIGLQALQTYCERHLPELNFYCSNGPVEPLTFYNQAHAAADN